MADTVRYKPAPGEIPTNPGVYRFRDVNRRVLYVGKAKNLRSRLSSYFAPLRTLHERTRRMVTTAASVEWTIVGSEYEALQLEFTWIKEFHPPFNIQFRDDKSYPYLAITLGDEVPRVVITRDRHIKDARYFGPYTKVWAIRETVDLMLKAFPMRSCTDGVYKRAHETDRPCLLGDIGRCAAPCVGRVSIEEHRTIAKGFLSFMAGNDRSAIRSFTQMMHDASAAHNYEAAAKYRDSVVALNAVLEKSAVVLDDRLDADVFGISDDELAAAVQQFLVRQGRIRGVRKWVVDKEIEVTRAELVGTVLRNAYETDFTAPRDVYVPELPDDHVELEQWLSERRRRHEGSRASRVRLSVPQRGDKASLLRTADINAKNELALYKTRRGASFIARSQALTELQDACGLADAPLRMECFDVSHLGGTNVVASMVVFEDGLPRKDQYRRFRIAETTDDTDSIYQVVKRRLAYIVGGQAATTQLDGHDGDDPGVTKKFAYPPNLLIVDGGKPQLGAAVRALAESGISDIAVCGIAKRLEEIWIVGDDYPVILPRNSEALFLMQRIRDEAHRFAITYQRARRKKEIGSSLRTIPGLGEKRVAALLKHFGSVTKVKQASIEQITEAPGIGSRQAETIYRTLRS